MPKKTTKSTTTKTTKKSAKSSEKKVYCFFFAGDVTELGTQLAKFAKESGIEATLSEVMVRALLAKEPS